MINPRSDSSTSPLSEGTFDIRQLLGTLFLHRKFFIYILGTCMGIGLIYCLFASDIYKATAAIEMRTQSQGLMSSESAGVTEDSRVGVIDEVMNTHFLKIQVPKIVFDVSQALMRVQANHDSIKEFNKYDLEHFVEANISFNRVPHTHLIHLSFEAESAALAQLACNIYAEKAVEAVKSSNKENTRNAARWLKEQIASTEITLVKAEQDLIQKQSESNIEGLISSLEATKEYIKAFNQKLVTHKAEATVYKEVISTLDTIQSNPEQIGGLPSSIPNADAIKERLKEYSDALIELETLGTKYTDKHPSMERQYTRIINLREELETEVNRARSTALSDYALAKSHVENVEKLMAENTAKRELIQKQMHDFDNAILPLKRAIEANDSSYKSLLHKLEEVRLLADEETSSLYVYDQASRPLWPIKPRKKLIMFFSMIFGFSLASILTLALHNIKDTVTSIYDLEMDLGQNLLGVVLHIDTPDPAKIPVMSHYEKQSQVAESMAMIRATLLTQSKNAKKQGWMLLVTSATPQEGKSAISSNLALTFRGMKKKVLLVDCDLRRPVQHKQFKIDKPEFSLVDALLSETPMDNFSKLPRSSGFDNLDIIPGHGRLDIIPTEFLESDQFKRFTDWARSNYDVIIIDSPPIHAASDALVIGRFTDDILMVSRSGKTKKSAFKMAVSAVNKQKLPLLGVILNDLKPDIAHTIGGNGYDSYYQYGYYAAESTEGAT